MFLHKTAKTSEPVDRSLRNWVVRKWLEGMSAMEISRKTGVSLSTVYRWIKQWRVHWALSFNAAIHTLYEQDGAHYFSLYNKFLCHSNRESSTLSSLKRSRRDSSPLFGYAIDPLLKTHCQICEASKQQ